MEIVIAISNVVLASMSILTMLVLIRQLRGSNNINKNNYFLTIDKCFAENKDMQDIYNILSENSEFPILCDFNKVKSSQLAAYLTFLESFNLLIASGGVVTRHELYSMFGHRIFSILHNKQIQCFEIEKYRKHYTNLFLLHEALLTYCIENNKARDIPNMQNVGYFINAGNFIKDSDRHWKGYKKYKNEIEFIMNEVVERYKCKRIKWLDDFVLNMLIKGNKYKIDGCYFRQCIVDDYSMLIKIQEKVVDDLKNNQNEDLFLPTKNEEIKSFLGRDDIFFICVQTPDGICAYSCTFFNDTLEYDLSRYFDGKKVATLDTIVVLPGFRGNKLQRKLQTISEEEAKRRNYDIIAATVSLDNIHSKNNLIGNGYSELKTISYEKQGKKWERLVVYKQNC